MAWAAYDRVGAIDAPGYVTFQTKAAGLPDMRPRTQRGVPSGAKFASACVETADPERLRPYLTETEWDVVKVIVDQEAFASRVWKGVPQEPRRHCDTETRMSDELIADLIAKQYLIPLPDDYKHMNLAVMCPCAIFPVLKSDGETLRLIWNGVCFNECCHTPPRFRITPLREMLQRLLQAGVTYFLAYDFKTWFVQLKCCEGVAARFTTRIKGKLYRVCGVPMGWAWACAVAHAVTVAFTRAVREELGVRQWQQDVVCAEWCIDNTIMALRGGQETADRVLAAVNRVAVRLGVQLKASATEAGPSVDWLLYRLDARDRTATFREDYEGRLKRLVARARRGGKATMAEWWSVLGLVVFSVYASRIPYTQVRSLFEWLAAHAPPQGEPPRTWAAQLVHDPPAWRAVWEIGRELLATTIRAPPLPRVPAEVATWAITDAATSGNNVVFLITPTAWDLEVYPCEAADIAERELCAFVRAAERAAAEPTVPGPDEERDRAFVGYIDNEPARVAAARGWSLWASPHLAVRLERGVDRDEARRVEWYPMRVGTEACVADAWTRRDAQGAAIPCQRRRWSRGHCSHTHFGPGRLCECVPQLLRDAGVDPRTAERWLAEPPARPSFPVDPLRSPLL